MSDGVQHAGRNSDGPYALHRYLDLLIITWRLYSQFLFALRRSDGMGFKLLS